MSAAALTIGRADLARDLAGIEAIDELTFTNPWTREMYEDESRRPEISLLFVVHAREPEVSGEEARVVAYCGAWVLVDELHINNLAVHPDWRRRGIARDLMRHVLREAARGGAPQATLEVRRSNEPARKLYEHLGFVVSGVRRHYYRDPVEDALILWLRPSVDQPPATESGPGSSADPMS
jgi:ribosomal-protein-alanine N-acetyltransferase